MAVHTTDRWARNIGAQSQALQRLAEAGVGFASVNEDIDFTSPEGRLPLTMLGATAGIVYFLVQDGPFDVPALRLNPRYLLHTIRSPAPRMVFFGYLGHMWELRTPHNHCCTGPADSASELFRWAASEGIGRTKRVPLSGS